MASPSKSPHKPAGNNNNGEQGGSQRGSKTQQDVSPRRGWEMLYRPWFLTEAGDRSPPSWGNKTLRVQTLGAAVLSRLLSQILREKCQNWGVVRENEPLCPIGIPAPQLRSPDPAGGAWPQENSDLAPSPGAGRRGWGAEGCVLFIKSSPAAEAPRDQNNLAPGARPPPPPPAPWKSRTSLALRNLFFIKGRIFVPLLHSDYKSIMNLLRRIGKLRKT